MPTTLLVLTWLTMGAAFAVQTPTPRYGEWTGTVDTGMMAIGGETTGIRLVTSAGSLELAATDAVLARLRQLNGQQVTVRGSLQSRAGVEIRTRSIITVTEVRRPTPSVRRTRALPLYLAFQMGQVEGPWATTIAALAPDARRDFNDRLALRLKLGPAAIPILEPGTDEQRRRLEAALTAYSGQAAAAEAAAYAKTATLYYEWEGHADGPLDEAASAATYLADHRATPLRSYLQLFVLHRLRAAFECAGRAAGLPEPIDGSVAKSEQTQRDAAAKYAALLALIGASSDGLTRALAADIDSVTYVYLDIGAHPMR